MNLLVVSIVIVLVVALEAMFVAKERRAIKKRANQEFHSEQELTIEELETRLGDSELMYEKHEDKYWLHVSLLIGLCSYLYWYIWWASAAIVISVAYVGVKFLTVRPFSTRSRD